MMNELETLKQSCKGHTTAQQTVTAVAQYMRANNLPDIYVAEKMQYQSVILFDLVHPL